MYHAESPMGECHPGSPGLSYAERQEGAVAKGTTLNPELFLA